MSTALDCTLIREEVADLLTRVAAHAGAASVHVQAGTDQMMAAELRCCAATLMSVSALVGEMRTVLQQGGRAA